MPQLVERLVRFLMPYICYTGLLCSCTCRVEESRRWFAKVEAIAEIAVLKIKTCSARPWLSMDFVSPFPASTRISLYVTSEETSRTFCEHAPGCQKDITSLQYIAHILHCPSCLWYLTTWLDRLVYRNDELEAPAKAQQCRNAGSVLCQVAVSQEVLLRPEDFGSQVGVSPLSPLRKVWLILLLDSLNMSQLRVPSSNSCGSRVMKQQARQRWNQMHKCLFRLETSHFIESDADQYIWPHVFFPLRANLTSLNKSPRFKIKYVQPKASEMKKKKETSRQQDQETQKFWGFGGDMQTS